MQGSFTGQILAEKLAKLNTTQQSIETLSHWCIFHRRSAKQIVDVWEREFFEAQRERRVSFLFLANDILQNSRRKGPEFVTEFWRVLSRALKDVMKNGDDSNRSTVLRLIDIWEERRVFGSHAQGLRTEFLGKEAPPSAKSTDGILPEKLVAVYRTFEDKLSEEEAVIEKCNDAIFNVETFEKEIHIPTISGQESSAIVIEELQNQEGDLLECVQQLEATEIAHSSIVFQLKETLRDQEEKLERARLLLQAAHAHAEQARIMQQQIYDAVSGQEFEQQQQQPESSRAEESLVAQFNGINSINNNSSSVSGIFGSGESECYVPTEAKPFDAAEVAAKLVACTSSAAMISSVLSSLAAENVVTPLQKLGSSHQQEEAAEVEDVKATADADEIEEEGEEPEAKRQKKVEDGHAEASLLTNEEAKVTSSETTTTSAAAAGTVSEYLEVPSLLLPFTFGSQFPLPVASSAPPGCASADYQQQSAAVSFFASAPQ